MLTITVLANELYNEENNTFVTVAKDQVLLLEHSLISLSKWESHYCKPFLTKENKTVEETMQYIKCMTLNGTVDKNVYDLITQKELTLVMDYIYAPMTATTFSNNKQKITNSEIITAELIYYWMVALTIPFECEKWHLNRLLTLINVCNLKNQPKKELTREETYARNRELNEQRRRLMGTKG